MQLDATKRMLKKGEAKKKKKSWPQLAMEFHLRA
jgi:hypothetical protein